MIRRLRSERGSITTAMAFIVTASLFLGLAAGATQTRSTIDSTLTARALSSSAVTAHAQALVAQMNTGGWRTVTVGTHIIHAALGVTTAVTSVTRDPETKDVTISLRTDPVTATSAARPQIVSTLLLTPARLGALSGIDPIGVPVWTAPAAGTPALAIYELAGIR